MNKFLEEFKGVAFVLMNPVEIERYVDYELSGNSKTYIHEELWQFVIEEMILPKKTRGKQEM
ncbi:hypothetical protein AT270_01635 [Bacillus cereus]|nr:hypothetical protein [Bacillus cereus]KXY86132.1 hypothetical protein AT270_01635 [Bacillus cereus]MBG9937280.1 hypothetical protein [Bacillus tropicus]OTY57624.1 hypothetical protein BK748_13885 [Bacillus thuringiensis serovar graciosensis]